MHPKIHIFCESAIPKIFLKDFKSRDRFTVLTGLRSMGLARLLNQYRENAINFKQIMIIAFSHNKVMSKAMLDGHVIGDKTPIANINFINFIE